MKVLFIAMLLYWLSFRERDVGRVVEAGAFIIYWFSSYTHHSLPECMKCFFPIHRPGHYLKVSLWFYRHLSVDDLLIHRSRFKHELSLSSPLLYRCASWWINIWIFNDTSKIGSPQLNSFCHWVYKFHYSNLKITAFPY